MERIKQEFTPKAGRAFFVLLIGYLALLIFAGYSVKTDNFGYVVMLGIPSFLGLFLSAWARLKPLTLGILIISALIGVITSVISLNIGGLLCTFIFFFIAGLPFLASALMGRLFLDKLSGGTLQLCIAPVFLLAIAENHFFDEWSEESVETEIAIAGTPTEIFKRLHFFEGSTLNPPLLLKLRLPTPIGVEGNMFVKGEDVRCIYEKGYLLKRITSVEDNKLIAFEVIEQHGIEDRSLTLTSGEIRLHQNGSEVIVKMTTRYQPKLGARLLWRQPEKLIVKTLHEHIARGLVNP